MVSRKLLSIFSLLLLGSHKIFAETAPALSACSTVTGFSSLATVDNISDCSSNAFHCIDSNIIYGYNFRNGCKAKLGGGVHIFLISNFGSKKANLETDISGSITKASIYNCDDTKCVQTFGYIKDSAKYYSIGISGNNAEVVQVEECSAHTTDGKIASTSGPKLCLGVSTVSSTFQSKHLLLIGAKSDITNPFTSSESAVNLAILADSNYFVLDNLYSDKIFINDHNEIVSFRDDYHSKASITDQLYTCTNGQCVASTTTSHVENGKTYLVNVDNTYKICKVTVSGTLTFTKVGDFVALKSTQTAKDEIFYEVETISTLTDLSNVSLYDCQGVTCRKTKGYFIYNRNKIATCTAAGVCTDYTIGTCSGAGDVGKLKIETNIKMCVGGTPGFKQSSESPYIFMSSGSNYIPYKMSTNIAAVTLEDEFLLMNDGLTVKTAGATGTLLKCSNGICTVETTYGYYLNAADKSTNLYIECIKEALVTKCTLRADAAGEVTCTATNHGKLVTSKKFCIYGTTSINFEYGNVIPGDYVVSYVANNYFEAPESKYYLVSVTDKSITLKTEKVKLPECTISSDKCKLTSTGTPNLNANSYCFKNGIIYRGDYDKTDGSCTAYYGVNKYDEGLLAFDVTNPENNYKISSESLDGKTVVLYDCAYGECVQTYGYIKSNDKVYLCSSTGSAEFTGVTCVANDGSTVGQVNYNSLDFSICILSTITVADDGASATATNAAATFTSENYFIIKPSPTPADDYFGGDLKYNNIGLVKTEPNIAALTMRNPQLPQCNTSCQLDGTTQKINDGGNCITSTGVIYKYLDAVCTPIYGESTSENGVKIFQKGSEFNEYIDVTYSLASVTAHAPELTPMFVIYDCNESGCTQTSGFVKYGSSSFMNCYTQANVLLYDNVYPIGCVKLNTEGNTCESAAATSGSCKFESPVFTMCFSPKTSTTTASNHVFQDVTMSIKPNEINYFLFESDLTPFPDTKGGDVTMLKIDGNSATLTKTINKGYYPNTGSVDGDGTDALIYCKNTDTKDCVVYPVTSATYTIGTSYPGYYINSGNDKATKPLIYCSGTNKNCISVKSNNGYYLNADPNENTKKLIKCINGICESVAPESSCSPGKVIKSGENYYLCINSSSADKKDFSAVTYNSVSVSANGFPGVTEASVITIKINGDGSAILLEEASLPTCDGHIKPYPSSECTSNGEVVNSCIINGKIFVTSSETCVVITETAALETDKTEIVYFKEDLTKIVKPNSATTEVIIAYKCSFITIAGGNSLDTCVLAKGYSTVSGTASGVYCTGWKGEPCVYVSTEGACTGNNDEGNLIIGDKLCFLENEFGITASTIAFEVSKSNIYYGVSSGATVVKLTATQALINIPTDDTPHYYINQNYRSAVNTSKTLIKCVSGICTSENGLLATSGVRYIDAGDDTNKKLISCSAANTACTSAVVSTGTYIDGSDANKIITCSSNGCISTKTLTLCTATTSNDLCKYGNAQALPSGSYCLGSDNKVYLSYTTETSSAINSCTAQTDDLFIFSYKGGFFEKGNIFTTTSGTIYVKSSEVYKQLISTYYLYEDNKHIKHLYHCDGSGSCTTINEPTEGFYVGGIQELSSTGPYFEYSTLIQCTGTKVEECSTLTDSNIKDGYYLDNGNTGNVIKCSSQKCITIIGDSSHGVGYLDKGHAAPTDTKYVITCMNGICTTSDKCTGLGSDKLYFINGDDNEKRIECISSKCDDDALLDTPQLDGTDPNYTITCANGLCTSNPECRVNTGVNCKDKTYYLIKQNTDTYIIETGTNNDLYYCSADIDNKITCNKITEIGYYINSKVEIYDCKEDSGLKCEKVSTALTNTCTVGVLFLDEKNNISLCLDESSGKYVELSSMEKNYVLNNNSVVLKQQTSKLGLIKVNENSFTFNTKYEYTLDNYVYVNDSTNKVMEHGICPIKSFDTLGSSLIKEYKCTSADNCIVVV